VRKIGSDMTFSKVLAVEGYIGDVRGQTEIQNFCRLWRHCAQDGLRHSHKFLKVRARAPVI